MIIFKEKFKKGDYIINRKCGDIAVYDKCDDKGYMHFKHYYGDMFKKLKDCKVYTMQINYQKFYDLCNEEEINKMNELVKNEK